MEASEPGISSDSLRKVSDPKRPLDPETALVSHGYEASEHLGSLKMPIYETSTFVFESAEEGKRFFEVAYGLDEAREGEEFGYIYTRLDGPNVRLAEARMAVLENSDDALVFNSGMAAIGTLLLTFLRPGDRVLYSTPAYGGTASLFEGMLPALGIDVASFTADLGVDQLEELAGEGSLVLVYVETPANPTNDIFDLAMAAGLAHSHDAVLVVDNTFLSPIWQQPVDYGADLVVHSATKYLGGHSDLTAGVICGRGDLIEELRHNRYRLGATAQPSTAWLLARSLETLRLRVERQTATATHVARYLSEHPKVLSVNHLSLLDGDDPRLGIYQKQCLGPGAMISFEVTGGEEGAFRFLNAIELIHLAVSLGGTESLASHPWTMSHSTMDPGEKERIGITPGLIRFSIGLESADDLISDLGSALSHI